jgi:hypothetical protein
MCLHSKRPMPCAISHKLLCAAVRCTAITGSPYLLLWGIIWAVGYVATGLAPERAALIWLLLDALGLGGTFFLLLTHMRSTVATPGVIAARRQFAGKYVLGMVILAVFWAATYSVLTPHAINQYLAFPAILMGAIYAVVGIIWLPRYSMLGVAISLLTLVGYFGLPDLLAFWMPAVGGGGLILGALWLRKA